MSSLRVENRVQHKKFGLGTVKGFGTQNVLIEWDTHRRKKPDVKHPMNQTHVRPTSVAILPIKG